MINLIQNCTEENSTKYKFLNRKTKRTSFNKGKSKESGSDLTIIINKSILKEEENIKNSIENSQKLKGMNKICKNLINEIFSFLNFSGIKNLFRSLGNKRIQSVLNKNYTKRITQLELTNSKTIDLNILLDPDSHPANKIIKQIEYIPKKKFYIFTTKDNKCLIVGEENNCVAIMEIVDYFTGVKLIPNYKSENYIAIFFLNKILIDDIENEIQIQKSKFRIFCCSDILFYPELNLFAVKDEYLIIHKINMSKKGSKNKPEEFKLITDANFIKLLNLNIFDIQKFNSKFMLVYFTLTPEGKKEINSENSDYADKLINYSNTFYIIDLVKLQVSFTLSNISDNYNEITNIFYSENYSKERDIIISIHKNSEVKVWRLSAKECIKTVSLPFSIKNVFLLDNIRSDFLYVLSTDNCQGILMLKEKPEGNLKIILKDGFNPVSEDKLIYVGSRNENDDNIIKFSFLNKAGLTEYNYNIK